VQLVLGSIPASSDTVESEGRKAVEDELVSWKSVLRNPDPDLADPHVLGLLDPDPFVRGLDPDAYPYINKQK
jgi:hypothetical protein